MVATIEQVNEDPQFTGPRPTPSLPDGGSYSVFNKVTINATPEEVLKALVTFSGWQTWNKLVPTVTVEKLAAGQTETDVWHEGQVVTFNCIMDQNKPDSITKNKEMAVQVGPLVTKASLADETAVARTVVRWVSQGLPQFVIKAEHVNWIDDNGDGTVTYWHWETFGGYAVSAVKMLHGKHLHDSFIAWADDLKAYVEQGKSQA